MPPIIPTTAEDARGPQGLESAWLTIDLDAIGANWRTLAARAPGSETGAVVKADAYGLGMERVAPALWDAGARRFYVAQTEEGAALRAILPEANIVVFAPTLPESFALARARRLVMSLNSRHDLELWRADAAVYGAALPTLLHVDTGMTRLGVGEAEAPALWAELTAAERDAVVEVASHLACADSPEHPMNRAQLDRFRRAVAPTPANLRRTLCNSSGMFLGGDFLQSGARPGMALYGLNPTPRRPNPMRRVVTLEARILQTRRLAHAETVGYGAAASAPTGARIATIAAGYADGLHRALGEAGAVHVGAARAPIIGRISMDLTAIDVSDIPEHLTVPGRAVEIVGPRQSVDDLARAAGTIGYEVLTSLGRRYARRYLGGPA